MILVELALGALTVIVCSSLFFTDRLLKREAEVEKELSQETEAKKAKSKLDAEEDRARRKFEFYREHPEAVKAERAAIAERRRILERARENSIKDNLWHFEGGQKVGPSYEQYDKKLTALSEEEAKIPLP
jgi:hypothetical protein